MKIQFFGSAQEVGRSCIVVNGRFLLDAGIKLGPEASEYPLDFSQKDIRAVFISHAHLDHTGALPLFNYNGLRCVIYATKMTRALTKVLLSDSIHIEQLKGQHPAYSEENINNILSYFNLVDYNRWYEEKGISLRYKLLDAGHIPGSSSVVLEFEDDDNRTKRLLYTGDINALDTNLMDGLTYGRDKSDLNKVDVMICESTYGARDHPPRLEQEKEFLDAVKSTIKKGGSVLIPAFSVGRAQEILIILAKARLADQGVTIYLDGMARKVTDLCLKHSKFIKDAKVLKNALDNVEYVKDRNQRSRIVKEQAIVVSTAGMMDGGPVMDYVKYYYYDSKNAILLTGYQGEGTNGRNLLEKGVLNVDGQLMKVKAYYEKFDFSAHSGQAQLIELIKSINPKVLLLNHGDPEEIEQLASKLPFIKKVIMPKNGEVIKI